MVERRETKRNVCILSGETHCFCERKQAGCGNIHDTLIGPHVPARSPRLRALAFMQSSSWYSVHEVEQGKEIHSSYSLLLSLTHSLALLHCADDR